MSSPSEESEFPFVVAVLAPLSGKMSQSENQSLSERRFIDVDRANFFAVMRGLNPRVSFAIDQLFNASSSTEIDISFSSLRDFGPDSIVRQVPGFRQALESRNLLAAIRDSLSGSEGFRTCVDSILRNGHDQNPTSEQVELIRGFQKDSFLRSKVVHAEGDGGLMYPLINRKDFVKGLDFLS